MPRTRVKICLACEGISNAAQARCGHCGAWLLPTDQVHYPERRGEADAGNPLLGNVIDGKYRLQSVLGRGGLGTVFQAVHIGSLMPVAVKLLHPRYAARPEYRRALLPEARRAATIAHERCARLLDVGEVEDGVAYLAMELVRGDTLEQLLREGPLPPGHAVQILIQVAEALVEIHAAGLVHCDLSPRNVMVAVRQGRWQVKVLDFGIARALPRAGGEPHRRGDLAGFANPAFAAPEQLAGQAIDARADLHALGTLGWWLLSGRLPVADGEPQQVAHAVLAGERLPWPQVAGVPRRLVRLLQRCLQLDARLRPGSASEVLRELQAIAAARRPAFGRSAVVAAIVAVLAFGLTGSRSSTPFLRLVAGSGLQLVDWPPPAEFQELAIQGQRLHTVSWHFGGFRPERLRAELSRNGLPLRRVDLQPEVDALGGRATLSVAQPGWREVVRLLRDNSADGPVDLLLVVPGEALFGGSRLRIDDQPPQCGLLPGPDFDGRITASTAFPWHASDDQQLVSAAMELRFADGRRWTTSLQGESGELRLGARLAQELRLTGDLGPGVAVVVARDAADHVVTSEPLPFRLCDVAAPAVAEVSGPAGEAAVLLVGERARLRVRLTAGEAGCTLYLGEAEQVALPLAATDAWQALEVPAAPLRAGAGAPLSFRVVDGAGNASASVFALALRERSLRPQFLVSRPGAALLGDELVFAEVGAELRLQGTAGMPVPLHDVWLEPLSAAGSAPLRVRETRAEAGGILALAFGTLAAGRYRLHLHLAAPVAEAPSEPDPGEMLQVPVRVLPAAIELLIPRPGGRYLPDLLQSGVLARDGAGLREGAGWRLAAELRPYLQGSLWVGDDVLLPTRLRPGSDKGPLLPEWLPLAGRNRLALAVRDVLDQPVRVIIGDRPAPRLLHEGHELQVVAEFWWHEAGPEAIGEELLVEFEQPARLSVRLPLPYGPDEREQLHLGLGQSEVAAIAVQTTGTSAIATFVLPYPLWSVAAQWETLPRQEYQQPHQRRLGAYLRTPMGRHEWELRLRTTRSTLRPVVLGELGDFTALPEVLRQVEMVPVLAPDGPFAIELPAVPPPQLYRLPGPSAVRGIGDFFLQHREFTVAEGRALVASLDRLQDQALRRRCVHAADPLGLSRLRPEQLLPPQAASAPAGALLGGLDFFQAYALCAVFGCLLGGDPDLFRLPMGCELELAAFGQAGLRAANGAAAHGRPVLAAPFRAAAQAWRAGLPPLASAAAAAGDLVPGAFGRELAGLDFGLREWVGDLPFLAGAELILAEWQGDLQLHLERVRALARGEAPPRDLAATLRSFACVRGLASGELDGLLDARGERFVGEGLREIPATVPGVLRTEQMRRDGRDLFGAGADRRLPLVGFRLAGGREWLEWLRRRT